MVFGRLLLLHVDADKKIHAHASTAAFSIVMGGSVQRRSPVGTEISVINK